MNTRNLVIGTFVLAVAITAATIVLLRQPEEQPPGGDFTAFFTTTDIPATQSLDPLIGAGLVIKVYVPRDALMDGALVDLRKVQGSTALRFINKAEQITANNVIQLDEAS